MTGLSGYIYMYIYILVYTPYHPCMVYYICLHEWLIFLLVYTVAIILCRYTIVPWMVWVYIYQPVSNDVFLVPMAFSRVPNLTGPHR